MANIPADGKLRYDTSTDQLFVIYDENVQQITDFIKGLSSTEINHLTNPDENKFYLAADTKELWYYANLTWNVIATSGAFEQIQSDWNQIDTTKKDFIKNKPEVPRVDSSYNPASANAQSGIAVAAAVSNLVKNSDIATNIKLGISKPDGITVTVDTDGTIHANTDYVLPKATTNILGGVKVDGVTIIADTAGVITSVLPKATTTTLGGVKVDGSTITVDSSGVITSKQYTLPEATASRLGGVKVDNTTITANSGVITVQHNNNDYSADQIKRTADTTSRINSTDAESALLKLGAYKTKAIATTDWISNTDPTTSTDYPYIATWTDTDFNEYSHPSWQMNGAGNIPTAAERDEIEKIREIYFGESGAVTLYAEELPAINLVLEIIGC